MRSTTAQRQDGAAVSGHSRSGDQSRSGWRRVRQVLGVAVITAALGACAPITRNHGYVPTEADLATLVVGQDTRVTAAPKVGRPSTNGLLNDTGWFYVQSRWEYRGALAPREVDRQVVALTFNEPGVLQNVERFGLERGQIVPLSRRVTESNVQGQSVLRQLFASFGRIGASQLIDN